uniref:S41 family peptidase n=2 Tax=Roseivirga sp. TaxID=1964215 RepID=UPI00404775F9
MKNLMTLILLITLSFNLSAQANCDCKPELDFVYEQMQTMSSFKDQIKGKDKENFVQTYQKLGAEMTNPMTLKDCFWRLNQLMSLVNDKHAQVFGKRPDFEAEKIPDAEFVKAYQASDVFLNFPKVSLDLDALSAKLKSKPVNEIEGIYNIGSKMKMGVYRVDNSDSLVGVILKSEIGTWVPGQIYAYIMETERASHYDMVYYSQTYKNLYFAQAQFFDNGMLFSNVVKEGFGKSYSLIEANEEEGYQLSRLEDDVQYLWLNSFDRRTMPAKRDALVEQINNELTAPNLIIDLRDNGGGADKISLPILKALKKKSVKIYVITNFYTGSNAEMTTVRLKDNYDAIQLGQRTHGAISYGSNYGKTFHSPSGLFSLYPTDMRQKQFIAYEEIGVAPDIALKADTDWIEQTLNYIKTRQQ